jgi:hypothetical protein
MMGVGLFIPVQCINCLSLTGFPWAFHRPVGDRLMPHPFVADGFVVVGAGDGIGRMMEWAAGDRQTVDAIWSW